MPSAANGRPLDRLIRAVDYPRLLHRPSHSSAERLRHEGAQRFVHPRLPARPRFAEKFKNVRVDSNADRHLRDRKHRTRIGKPFPLSRKRDVGVARCIAFDIRAPRRV